MDKQELERREELYYLELESCQPSVYFRSPESEQISQRRLREIQEKQSHASGS